MHCSIQGSPSTVTVIFPIKTQPIIFQTNLTHIFITHAWAQKSMEIASRLISYAVVIIQSLEMQMPYEIIQSNG